MLKNIDREKKRNYFIALICSIAVMVIFANSYYWPVDTHNFRKIVEWIIVCLFVVIVPFVIVKFANSWMSGVCSTTKDFIIFIRKNIIKLILYLLGIALSMGFSYLLTRGLERYLYDNCAFNNHRCLTIFAVIFIVYNLFIFKNKLKQRPDYIFALVALVTGITLILVSPAFTGVSWDDEIHYNRTLSIANVFNGVYYNSDYRVINEYQDKALFHACYDRASYDDYMIGLNESYSNHELVEYTRMGYGYYSIAYIPSALGILFGRGLGLSYEHIFMMGKFFNLLCYVILMTIAIKKIRYGKVLLACFGLIPTSIFMASMYSYDFWVIAFISLGYAYLFKAMQADVFIVKDVIKAVVFILIGCIPKAIYFVMILPAIAVLVIRSDNKRLKRVVGIGIIAAAVLLLLSFMIPTIMSASSYSDIRGGEEVNTTGQIMFIMHYPAHYAKLLLGFLKSYLAVESMSYFQLFAYAGTGPYWVIIVVVLGIVAFLDHGKIKKNENMFRLTIWVICIITVVLIVTALYISFNPVGAGVINGCQPRYLLPVLFPMLYSIGSSRVENSISKTWFNILPQLVIALAGLYSVYCLFVLAY